MKSRTLHDRQAGCLRTSFLIWILMLSLAPAPARASEFRPFCFFLLGDPQYNAGHGPEGMAKSLERFATIARQANTTSASFALIPGDLVNDLNHNPQERAAETGFFARGMKEFKIPAYLIPGNHDIYDPASLARYRQEHGRDYYSFSYHNCEFICLNSVTLREPAAYPVESRSQMAWLEGALAAARAARSDHIFILMHHPPFESVDEVSVPQPVRRYLVNLFLHYGVEAVLAGHLHYNQELATWGGIPIYTAAGTATVYGNDPRGYGYRIFVVTRRAFRQFYVQLETELPAPAAPARPRLAAMPGAGQMPALLWDDLGVGGGALRYRVWRDGAAAGETMEPAFTDAACPPGARPAYQVTAIGLDGRESAKSPPLKPAELQPVELVGRAATWRAWDRPVEMPWDWKMGYFGDGNWKRGRLPLGVPGQIAPVIWLRCKFPVGETATLRGLALRLLAGDGAVAWLNGTEIARVNMPRGTATSATLAMSAPAAPAASETAVDPALLVNDSTNTLAIQLHRAGPQTATMVVDAALTGVSDPAALRLTRGPYLQAGGPTQVVVRWRTSQPGDSRVSVGEKKDALTRVVDDAASSTEHVVRVAGLEPGKLYYYAVGTRAERLAGGESCRFLTAPPPGTALPTRIWAIGDSGTANADAAAVRDAYLAANRDTTTNLWLMLGDNAYSSGTDAQHQAAVFDMYPMLLRNTFLYPCPGNHEYFSREAGGRPAYFENFTVPMAGEAGGVASGSPNYYSFDYGNIHFISLDSDGVDRSAGGAMMTWLKRDAADARARKQMWTIAFFHHPPYTKGGHDSDSLFDQGAKMFEMRQNALPILEEAGVDLVLTGHSHSYERSYLVDGFYGLSNTLQPWMMVRGSGNFRTDGPYLKPTLGLAPHEGTVYAVVGSSGQLTNGPLNHPVMCKSMLVEGSMFIDVDGRWLAARFLDRNGQVRDYFNIMKGAALNQLGKRP